ncbi:MAG: hypothetical protein ACYCW6_05215 [Candidatus Xenobia bacterium]
MTLEEYQQGRRVVRLCPQCVSEREADGEVLPPATRPWTLADLPQPRPTIAPWLRWSALLLLIAAALALYLFGSPW